MRWFRHVDCRDKEPDDWVSACINKVVESVKGRVRGRPSRLHAVVQCVDNGMTNLNLSVKNALDCVVWKNGILVNRLTSAVARKKDVKL